MDNYISIDGLRQVKGFQVIHHNVRSLFQKIDSVRNDFVIGSMDVICFSESWLNADIPDDLLCIDDFILLRNDRTRGRGVERSYI